MADLAFVLSTLAGPDPRAPLSVNEPGELFARPLERNFKGVRVAWFKDLGGVPFDARVRTWWMRIAQHLNRWGALLNRRSRTLRLPRSLSDAARVG